ncbi:MAG: YceI family protein [Gemmatimonadetes bacterium]|nr:YceI family protein [Gemmatimonadota bacterium]
MASRTWTLDPAHTSVELSVRHMMFTKVRGRFDDVEGTLEVDEERPDRSKVHVQIGTASIDTGVGDRDKHLRSADFLDADKHPTLTFESKRIEGAVDQEGDRFRVVGDLTIRGTTREVTLDVVYAGRRRDPWGNQRAGFEATTKIDRREWGLTWNQSLETGGILVGNEVSIELGVQAVLKEAGEREEAHAMA